MTFCYFSKRYAFTLIELLVVIAVIVILASLLLSAIARAKVLGQGTRCQGVCHRLLLDVNTFTIDNSRWPALPDLMLMVQPTWTPQDQLGVNVWGSWDGVPGRIVTNMNGFLISQYPVFTVNAATVIIADGQIDYTAIFPGQPIHAGANYGCCDGHVDRIGVRKLSNKGLLARSWNADGQTHPETWSGGLAISTGPH